MSRILVPFDETAPWYDELAVVSTYTENEYEEKIKQYAQELFTEYYTVRYKKPIQHDGTTKKADLVLISKNYEAWWIVEVELSGHSIDHVVEQVTIFKNGDYNSVEIIEYIKRVFSEEIPDTALDEARLSDLVTNTAPGILVIVDQPTESWRSTLEGLGIALCDLQVFKNTTRKHAYRLSGDYPSIFVRSTHLKFHDLARNVVEVIGANDFAGDLTHGLELVIDYKGKAGKWAVDEVRGKKYLKCLGHMYPFPIGYDYVLKCDINGRFSILDS